MSLRKGDEMNSAFIGLAYAWPFLFLAGALGFLMWLGHSPPSDDAIVLSFIGCLFAAPVQVWYLSRRLYQKWPGSLGEPVALLLSSGVSLAGSIVAMLVFFYALFFTGLFGD